MGGNIEIDGIRPKPIDITEIDRRFFTSNFKLSLKELNEKFEERFGRYLWVKKTSRQNWKIFSGSTEHLFNVNLSDEELMVVKTTFGDIDIKIRSTDKDDLMTLFLDSPDAEPVFGYLRYIGASNSAINQISSLFEFRGEPIQIDFECCDFENGEPSDWSRFSRCSNWYDLKIGIKGVFHKYLIGAIDFAYVEEAFIIKGMDRIPEIANMHPYSFSVQHGMREKYNSLCLIGRPIAYELIKKEDYKYTKDLTTIFQMLFAKNPISGSLADVGNMWSFTGLLSIVNCLFAKSPYQKGKIFLEFVERCFGTRAQKLYRDRADLDFLMKMTAVNFLMEKLQCTSHRKYVIKMAEEYYLNYLI